MPLGNLSHLPSANSFSDAWHAAGGASDATITAFGGNSNDFVPLLFESEH